MVMFVFGLCGVGKSYVGREIAEHFGVAYLDGDALIPSAMKTCIDNHEPITQDALLEYMTVLENHLAELVAKNEPVVISQALYRNRYREQFSERFPSIDFIEVFANDETCFSRVAARNNWVNEQAARGMRDKYDDPKTAKNFVYHSIDNNLNANLAEQIADLRAFFPPVTDTTRPSAALLGTFGTFSTTGNTTQPSVEPKGNHHSI